MNEERPRTVQREDTAMTKHTRLSDAEMRARALSRWEGEGGALAPAGAAESIDESDCARFPHEHRSEC